MYRYARARAPRQHERAVLLATAAPPRSACGARASGGLSLATNGKPDASLGPDWFRRDRRRRRAAHARRSRRRCCCRSSRSRTRRRARRAAVIGQGSGMSSHVLLGSPTLERLVDDRDRARDDPRRRAMFYPANRRVFDDPRSTFVHRRREVVLRSRGARSTSSSPSRRTRGSAASRGCSPTSSTRASARYLTPSGVFGQWLHLYEINDGLVLSVRARRARAISRRTRSTSSAATTSSSSRRSSRPCRRPTGRCSSDRAPRRTCAACCHSRRRS